MLNMIRADVYRLFKTKGFWITQVIIIALILVTIVSGSGISFMVNDQVTNEPVEQSMNGILAIALATMTFLRFFTLPLIIFIIGNDFTKDTLKNIVTTGISRTKYFFAKLSTYALILAVQIIWIYLVAFILGTIKGGTGDLSVLTFQNQAYYFFSQWLIITAITMIASIAIYMTKSTLIGVAIPIVLPMIINIIRVITDNKLLQYIDFQGALDSLNSTTFSCPGDIPAILLSASLFVIWGSLLNCLLFVKQDL